MTMHQPFIFELYTEEIPHKEQKRAIDFTKQFLKIALEKERIDFDSLEVSGTARRLYCYIPSLATEQNSLETVLKGPPHTLCFNTNKQFSKQLLGFSQKVQIAPEDIQFKKIGNTIYAIAYVKETAQPLADVLANIIHTMILKINFIKKMRWQTSQIQYARPILHYFCMLGKDVLSFSYPSVLWENIQSTSLITIQDIPEKKISIQKASNYIECLKEQHIIVHAEERKKYIRECLLQEANKQDVILEINEKVLEEVSFLVEKPQIVCASFKESYLQLPEKLIISEMEIHQRYFPTRNKHHQLTTKFFIVANNTNTDTITYENIQHGNEKVISARLNDGLFFFEKDRRKNLETYIASLNDIVFYENFGTLFDKKERLKTLATLLCQRDSLNYKHTDLLHRACDLLKADLATHMVCEFEHLQGYIGSIYAKMDDENNDIVQVIQEHYLPKFQGDHLPSTQLSIILSIADKIDNIMAGFALGKTPSSSTDPLGLRRQTLAILDILIKYKIDIDMYQYLIQISDLYPKQENLAQKVLQFFIARLRTTFEKHDFPKKWVNAILHIDNNHNIYHNYLKLDALRHIQDANEFDHVIELFKRMYNITKEYPDLSPSTVSSVLFQQQEEKILYDILTALVQAQKEVDLKGYANFLNILVNSKKQIDTFFDNVFVNHESIEIRHNRIALLKSLLSTIEFIFDLKSFQ